MSHPQLIFDGDQLPEVVRFILESRAFNSSGMFPALPFCLAKSHFFFERSNTAVSTNLTRFWHQSTKNLNRFHRSITRPFFRKHYATHLRVLEQNAAHFSKSVVSQEQLIDIQVSVSSEQPSDLGSFIEPHSGIRAQQHHRLGTRQLHVPSPTLESRVCQCNPTT